MALYFLWGDEDFNIELQINKIKKEFLKEQATSLNFQSLDNPNFARLIEILKSQPMLFGKTLYLLKVQKYFLETKSKQKLEDDEILELIEGFKNLNPEIGVILVCPVSRSESKKPDSRKKLYKEIAKLTQVQHFPALKPWETYKAVDWLKNQVKEKELKFNFDALNYFPQIVGVNLRELDSELDKIKLTIYPKNIVTKEIIDKVCTRGQDIFAFCDLIADNKKDEALQELKGLLEKEHYLSVLAFLHSVYRKWILTRMYSKTKSSFEIAKITGQNEFVVKKTLSKLNKIPLETLINLKLNLTEAEYNLKTGSMDAILAIETALLK